MRAGLNTFQLECTQIKASPKQENPIKTKNQYRLGHFFQARHDKVDYTKQRSLIWDARDATVCTGFEH